MTGKSTEYFGKQRRWVFAWLLVASIGVLYGYVHVAERAWVVSPLMWLLLMVMVPPVVVNFWLRIGHPRLTLAEHQATVANYREHGETVDVFLPSCGEPLEVLNNTFQYVSRMDWRGVKTVYVLDDSAREKVRDLADWYDFRYIVRPNPGEMKKAGNLLHALDLSAGDFIAVIDADFAVRREFLYETMPYFSDPKVGIVQTAQYFDVGNRSFSYIQRYAGAASGDLLPVHPAGPGPLQGGDLRGHESGLPPLGCRGRGRLRAGADRRGRALRRETVRGRDTKRAIFPSAWPRG